MVKSSTKRSLPADPVDTGAKKRKRSGGLPQTQTPVNSSGAPLQWRKVPLPDRLDDWEGFVELEEVDDAEVVKDEFGKVSFRLRASIEATNLPDQSLQEDRDWENDDTSWSGLEDERHDVTDDTIHEERANQKSALKNSPRPEQSIASKRQSKTEALQSSFELLNDQSEDTETDVSAWRSLKLSPDTLASLARLRFSHPKPIQKAAIPEILAGHDVIGKASTGSGKTLAFGIPIFESFLETNMIASAESPRSPLALILSPTRELARQIETHLKDLCSNSSSATPTIATLVGGLSLQKQRRLLKDADIIIGTPGRLWEIISEGQGVGAALQRINFLIIDEADRLLSEGHFKEVDEILNTLERVDQDDEAGTVEVDTTEATSHHERQTLVFSATFDRGLQKRLAGKTSMRNNMLTSKESLDYLLSKLNFREEVPKFIDVNPINQMAAGLKEGLVECAGTEKDLYAYALTLLHPNTRVLIFVNSINAVRRLTPLLQNLDVHALALHSGMPQKARLRSIERFSQTKNTGKESCSVLIATDVAARGLDIPNVQLVIHYHLPRTADLYVHRSGRTARADQKGSSILICGPEEVAGVRRLVAKVHAQSAIAVEKDASEAAKQGYYIRTLDIDRRVVARLKERTNLAKKLADASLAREKHSKEDDFLRNAAEELGVEYDSEELENGASGRRGRGSGRKKKERAARELSKVELGSTRAELRSLLKQRVNVGVSERYLASGAVNVDELLRQQDAGGVKTGEFLGTVGGLGLEDF